jgi:GT2 family glycosyltransferase
LKGPGSVRPRAGGKFLFVGDEKLWVRGVSYGAFRPDAEGREYHDLAVIERDFAQMARNDFNAVRIPHTMPPRALLDAAERHGLHVMVGLGAEHYAGFLIDGKGAPDVAGLVRESVRRVAGHPALLCYAIGNEIQAPMARLLGARRVERYLELVYDAIKAEDPDGLVTYVNYPTTEYLHLPFLDLVAFNVYLESPEPFARYLARLHNVAGDRPLLMSEIGLDSLRNGEGRQAEVLDWQVRATFAGGCAGAFVFSWTDEWFRAGAEVDDWAFGLTDRARRPKPALAAVREAILEAPVAKDAPWPRISVVVCSHNGARTLADCCEGLLRLEYPDYEVIVVDDGSTDGTAAIARRYGFRVISTSPQGLSSARNTGLRASTGAIVAYIDDDAWPDPHWLTYLGATFMCTRHVGVGGPNLPPPGDGFVADAVANAPGGPIHVLLTDEEAEHIPGCNMAFRRDALEAIDGFDAQFRTAGDDVDVCWRLQGAAGTLGFSPAAMVWHHRRNSIRAYWRQQHGYGRAEASLERKWPEKYNGLGHLTWAGRVYTGGLAALGWRRGRVYQGLWGSAPFQSVYQPASSTLGALVSMPEWYLLVLALAIATGLGAVFAPLAWSLPLLVVAVAAPILRAVALAWRVRLPGRPRPPSERVALRSLTAFLHLLQPLARLSGRLSNGLTPARWRVGASLARWFSGVPLALPRPHLVSLWCEQWREPLHRLAAVEQVLRAQGVPVRPGGEFDRWDLEASGGVLGGARLLMAVEDHGGGTQFVRLRIWPRWSWLGFSVALVTLGAAAVAALGGASAAAVWLTVVAMILVAWAGLECAMTTAVVRAAAPHAELDRSA